MAEQRRHEARELLASLSDEELGRHLSALADESFPPTPSIASAVRVRIEAEPAPPASNLPWAGRGWLARPLRHSTVLALLAVVALVAVAGAAILGVPGIRLVFTDATPSISAMPSVSAAPSAAASPTQASEGSTFGAALGLGEATTLEAAVAAVDFDVLVPDDPGLGPPDEIYLRELGPTHQVSMVWLARDGLPAATGTGVGLLLMEFPGTLVPDQYEKLLSTSTRVVNAQVNGGYGFWIEGGSHYFVEGSTPASDWMEERIRLAGNTLIWQQADLTLRLEADFDQERAQEIAATLGP